MSIATYRWRIKLVFVERIAALRFNAFALTERGMLRRYTQGGALLCPGLMGVSLSGYNYYICLLLSALG